MKIPYSTSRPRQRGPKAPLSREAVVHAALDCLQTGGPAALTMRKVAALLETGPGSLYVYVRDQSELHVFVLDAIASEVPLSVASTDGELQLLKLLISYARQLFKYPGTARLALLTPPTGPAFLDLFETALSLLVAAGFTTQRAVWAADALFLLVTAAVAEQDARPRDDPSRSIADLYGAAIDSDESARRPYLSAARSEFAVGGGELRLEWAVCAFFRGLAAAPEPPHRDAGPTPTTSGENKVAR